MPFAFLLEVQVERSLSNDFPKNGAPKYLLVEAENPLREEFIDLLESYDAVVYIAKDQAEALKYLARENIDLMIVAALSPLEKTPDFLNQVRRQDNSKDMPLLLISNY